MLRSEHSFGVLAGQLVNSLGFLAFAGQTQPPIITDYNCAVEEALPVGKLLSPPCALPLYKSQWLEGASEEKRWGGGSSSSSAGAAHISGKSSAGMGCNSLGTPVLQVTLFVLGPCSAVPPAQWLCHGLRCAQRHNSALLWATFCCISSPRAELCSTAGSLHSRKAL